MHSCLISARVDISGSASLNYATYKNYKPSPISWVDQMPEHWHAAALRWLSRRYAGGTPDKGNDAYWEGGDIPWINSGAVNDGYITQPSELITREGFANSSAKWIPKGALVIALAGQGKTKGMVAQLGITTTCNQSMAAVVPDRRFDPRYLYWWLTSNYQNIRNLAGGEARDGLNLDMLGSIPCPVPPLQEQQTIAWYLDAKTAQIDDLMAKKRQLIDKLKEERQALVTRTVTRGLPHEAANATRGELKPKMKDSGIEWIGPIPSTWEVERLRRVCRRVTDGAHISPDLSSDDFPFVSTVDIGNGKIDLSNCLRTSIDCYEYLVRTGCKPFFGDVLFSKDGTVGRTAVVEFSADFVVASSLVIISPEGSRLNSRFLDYWLNNSLLQQEVTLQMAGAALRRISVEKVGRLPVILPPLHEQQAIVKYLDAKVIQSEALVAKAEAAIDRLGEYRQALITSAVTGKIDVRGLA